MTSGFLALTVCCSYLYSKAIFYLNLPVAFSSASSSLHYFLNYYHEIQWERTLKLLQNKLKKLHFYVRKTSQYLQEYDAFFCSDNNKQKKRTLRYSFTGKPLPEAASKLYFERKETEINILKQILYKCLLDIICATKDGTKRLIKVFSSRSLITLSQNYLAFYTNGQLGLDKYFETKDFLKCEATPLTSDVLINIYLLLQSEYLKHLGLCLCPNLWDKDDREEGISYIFEVVKEHLKSYGDILDTIRYHYENHFLPKDFEKKNNTIQSEFVEGYSLLHKLSSSLNLLLTGVRILEQNIELTDSEMSCDKILYTNSKLCDLENEFEETIICMKDIKMYFQKLQLQSTPLVDLGLTTSKSEIEESNQDLTCEENIKKTNVIVGYSDFTPPDSDQVYLCVTDGEIESSLVEEFEDITAPCLPESVLSELKDVLVNKKKEFDERESKVIKKSVDYEHYRNFIKFNDDFNSFSLKTKQKRQNCGHEFSSSNDKGLNILNEVGSDSLNFQKCLAFNAVSKSFAWNKYEEETFGDSNGESSDCNETSSDK